MHPITAFLLLVSAWARRSVQLWVFLPPVILIMMERIALGSSHVWNILWYRLGGVFTHSGLAYPAFGNAAAQHRDAEPAVRERRSDAGVRQCRPVARAWCVAALLIVATIRIRQYRDDT